MDTGDYSYLGASPSSWWTRLFTAMGAGAYPNEQPGDFIGNLFWNMRQPTSPQDRARQPDAPRLDGAIANNPQEREQALRAEWDRLSRSHITNPDALAVREAQDATNRATVANMQEAQRNGPPEVNLFPGGAEGIGNEIPIPPAPTFEVPQVQASPMAVQSGQGLWETAMRLAGGGGGGGVGNFRNIDNISLPDYARVRSMFEAAAPTQPDYIDDKSPFRLGLLAALAGIAADPVRKGEPLGRQLGAGAEAGVGVGIRELGNQREAKTRYNAQKSEFGQRRAALEGQLQGQEYGARVGQADFWNNNLYRQGMLGNAAAGNANQRFATALNFLLGQERNQILQGATAARILQSQGANLDVNTVMSMVPNLLRNGWSIPGLNATALDAQARAAWIANLPRELQAQARAGMNIPGSADALASARAQIVQQYISQLPPDQRERVLRSAREALSRNRPGSTSGELSPNWFD